MAKIITVYTDILRAPDILNERLTPVDMSYIRWFSISKELAHLGHKVDIASNEFDLRENNFPIIMSKNLRRVRLDKVKWNNYDVVKTVYHAGFNTLKKYGGLKHPFIISKLGSVVAPADRKDIYFYGRIRKDLYAAQELINKTSRYISVLTGNAKRLWQECFGIKNNLLIVAGATDRLIPEKGASPYPDDGRIHCIYAGNLYTKDTQPEANAILVEKLNTLGNLLAKKNIRLFVCGRGDITKLDPKAITHLGAIPYPESWQYIFHADIGIVLSPVKKVNNNESTKLYYYLRAGLPTVMEKGFPNEKLLIDAKLGFISPNSKPKAMAQDIETAANIKAWDKKHAIRLILNKHTWDKRAQIYDEIIRKEKI